MKQLPTISIGIPAYNEQANIKQLLLTLLKQQQSHFTLAHIYVISDGSTDNTKDEVLSIHDKRVIFVDDKKRVGKSARINEILRRNSADILVLMDADICITDTTLLTKLVKKGHITENGIVGINAVPAKPNTFFEQVLDTSVLVTKKISQKWNNGDNYLSFKGCFLALSAEFAGNVQLPKKLTNNDAFLYFAAKKAGYKTGYIQDCSVYYSSPNTLVDHIKQSSRFQASKNELQKYFPSVILSYSPPVSIVLRSMAETFISHPVTFVSYIIVHMIAKYKKQSVTNPTWQIAHTTKQKIALSH